MSRKTLALLCTLISAYGPVPLAGQILQRGPNSVGLRTVEIRDPTRSGADKLPYRTKVWLWFPIAAVSSPTSAVGSMLDEEFEVGNYDWLYREPVSLGADSTALEAILHRETGSAWSSAPPTDPRHLIVAGQGVGHPAFANFGTNELLASHGYVVAATSYGWTETGLSALENQVRDYTLAMEAADREFPSLDLNAVGLLAHSAGGLAAAITASRSENVGALVLLDPSLLGRDGAARLRRETGWNRGLEVPTLLALSHWWRLGTDQHANLESTILDDFRGPRVTMDMRFMEHPDFVTLDHLRSETLDYAGAGLLYDYARAGRGLEFVQSAALRLFDWALRGDSLALAALEAGFPSAHQDLEFEFRR